MCNPAMCLSKKNKLSGYKYWIWVVLELRKFILVLILAQLVYDTGRNSSNLSSFLVPSVGRCLVQLVVHITQD